MFAVIYVDTLEAKPLESQLWGNRKLLKLWPKGIFAARLLPSLSQCSPFITFRCNYLFTGSVFSRIADPVSALVHCCLPNAQHSKAHRKKAQKLFGQLVKDWTINGPTHEMADGMKHGSRLDRMNEQLFPLMEIMNELRD